MKTNDRFEAVIEAVMQIDLSPIKRKLMHAASGEGWSFEKADAVEREYRRFLCLTVAYPDEAIAPVVDVDTFWHYHILDTMKYAADCQQAFGYFVHHYPYVGLHGDDDDQARIDGGERTRTLYAAMFGAPSPQTNARADRQPALPAREQCGTAATAWCASPGARDGSATAWCASPGSKEIAQAGAAIAWCASPGAKFAAPAGNTVAWCASPGTKLAAPAGNTLAWCASPGARNTALASGGATAWCASPGAKKIRHPG